MAKPAGTSSRPSRKIEAVEIDLPITVGQFVKVAGLASTGGEAKLLVGEGEVRVNGEVETRRGHKLVPGDVVSVGGNAARVVARSVVAGDVPPSQPATRPRG